VIVARPNFEIQSVREPGLIKPSACPGIRAVVLGLSRVETDRWGGLPLTLALSQASVGLSYLAWAGADGYVAMAWFSLWVGLSYGGIVSLLPALCMDLFGARAVSSIIGTLYTAAAFGNLLGPWVAGALFDARHNYALVILGCLGLSALATAATWKLVRRANKASGLGRPAPR